MKVSIVLLLLLFSIAASSQPASLGERDIRITNLYDSKVTVRFSNDKVNWTVRVLDFKYGIDITIPKSNKQFYVELCQTSQSNKSKCDTYLLKPANRYVIKYNAESKELDIFYAN